MERNIKSIFKVREIKSLNAKSLIESEIISEEVVFSSLV